MPGRGWAQGIITITINGHHMVDLKIDIMDQKYEGIEPFRNSRAATERSDICNLIEDEEDNRVRQPLEFIQVTGWVSIYSCFGLHFIKFVLQTERYFRLTSINPSQ